MVSEALMARLTAIMLLVLMLASCTTADLWYASTAMDLASDMIDFALGPWYVPHGHRPPPPPYYR